MPHTGTIKKYVDMLLPVFIAHVSHASLRRINATRMLKTHLTFVIMLFIALCLGGGGEQPVHPSLISNTDGMRLLITPSRDKKTEGPHH